MIVSVLAHGVGPLEFFQVLVVDASTVDAAKRAARSYLARLGRRVIDFDEEETREVLLESVRLPRVEPNPDGVVAASGCIWVDESAN